MHSGKQDKELSELISSLTKLHDTSIFFSKKEELKSLEKMFKSGGFETSEVNSMQRYLQMNKVGRFLSMFKLLIKGLRSVFGKTWSQKKQKRINQLNDEIEKYTPQLSLRYNSNALYHIEHALMELGDIDPTEKDELIPVSPIA